MGEGQGRGEGVAQPRRVVREPGHRLHGRAGEGGGVRNLPVRGGYGDAAGAVEADQPLDQTEQVLRRPQRQRARVLVDDRDRGQAAPVPPVHARRQPPGPVLVGAQGVRGQVVEGVQHRAVGYRMEGQQVPGGNDDQGTGGRQRLTGDLPRQFPEVQRLGGHEVRVTEDGVQRGMPLEGDLLVGDGHPHQVGTRRLPQLLGPGPLHVPVGEGAHTGRQVEGVGEDQLVGHDPGVPHATGDLGGDQPDGQQPGVHSAQQFLGTLAAVTGAGFR